MFVCPWTGLNEQTAQSLVLPTDELYSAVTQEERSAKDRVPWGNLANLSLQYAEVELHFLFLLPTVVLFFYLYPFMTNRMCCSSLLLTEYQSAHVCLLFLHYLLIEWLCGTSSGSGSMQLGPLSPIQGERRQSPPLTESG